MTETPKHTVSPDIQVAALNLHDPQTLKAAYELDVEATQNVPGVMPVSGPEELMDYICTRHPYSETYGAFLASSNVLVGYATIAPKRPREDLGMWRIAELVNIGVTPDRTKAHGIGSFLFDHCLKKAVEHGAQRLDLFVSVENERAVLFYVGKCDMVIARHIGDEPFGPGNGQRMMFTRDISPLDAV